MGRLWTVHINSWFPLLKRKSTLPQSIRDAHSYAQALTLLPPLQPRHDLPGAHGLGGEGLPPEAPRGPHHERQVMSVEYS